MEGMEYQEFLSFFAEKFIDLLMIFSPSVGYIAQGKKFRQVKSSEGFSKLICLILLIANLLRIFFWIGKQFAVVLLFQSIVAVITQLYLLREALKYSKGISHINRKAKTFLSLFEIDKFWNWPDLFNYLQFASLFCVLVTMLSLIIGYSNQTYVDFLGGASAAIEATLGLPQVYKNYINKSTENLSLVMISTWVLGDSFKSWYFYKTDAPIQLLCCGLFQLLIDFVIVGQINLYRTSRMKDEKRLMSGNAEEVVSQKEL